MVLSWLESGVSRNKKGTSVTLQKKVLMNKKNVFDQKQSVFPQKIVIYVLWLFNTFHTRYSRQYMTVPMSPFFYTSDVLLLEKIESRRFVVLLSGPSCGAWLHEQRKTWSGCRRFNEVNEVNIFWLIFFVWNCFMTSKMAVCIFFV